MKREKPEVSASIIAYNEEAIIEQTVKQILPYVQEVIICDTGSTDKTKEIARKAGARVEEIGWDMDFSNARNKALSKSHTDWVLTIDCDETMSDELICFLAEMVRYGEKENIAAYYFWRISEFDGRVVGEENQPRLLHRKRCQWQGVKHEGIAVEKEYITKFVPKEYKLYHRHTMKKQRWSNKLYFNIDNGIVGRPKENEGMEYDEKQGKWVDV